jgi:hypothetical protein
MCFIYFLVFFFFCVFDVSVEEFGVGFGLGIALVNVDYLDIATARAGLHLYGLSKITPMPALKKPFTLLLILSHLNTFVLGSVGNVYATNQEVNTEKSPQTRL